MCGVFVAIVVAAVLVPGASFGGTVYPCPSDPGFCYRDIGDDGCFDAGVDEGPINDEIQSSTTIDPAPPPGSVICPPSVEVLEREYGDIVVTTPSGSSIRFYGRPKISPALQLYSGGDILLQGTVEMYIGRCDWFCTNTFFAEGNVLLEASILTFGFGKSWNSYLRVQSDTGDVIIGPKTRHGNSNNDVRALAGNVTILEKVNFNKGNLTVRADGELSADGLRVKSYFIASVEGISLAGRTKARWYSLDAGAGDFSTEGLQASGGGKFEIAGHNITIGTSPTERTRHKGGLKIDATGDIRILGLVQGARDKSTVLTTTGTLIEVLGSKMSNARNRWFDITAGPGSTCDLTGTTFKKRRPDVRCDTVIGP